MASVVSIGLCLRSLSDRPDALILLVLVGVLVGATATSSISYVAYAAPVAFPVLLASLDRARLVASVPRVAVGLLFIYLVPYFLAPSCNRCFVRLDKLPPGTPAAGLYAPEPVASYMSVLLKEVAPLIRGHRVLWLCSGGPHCLYGGAPVRNVASFYLDTYHSRQETGLWREWHLKVPDYVFRGAFLPAPGAALFQPASIQAWLDKDFSLVWTNSSFETSLWRRDLEQTRR
jgi:hypothetical protein